MGRGPLHARALHVTRAACHLQDCFGRVDEAGAKERVLRERAPGRRHGFAALDAERAYVSGFVPCSLGFELDGIQLTRVADAGLFERAAPGRPCRFHGAQPLAV